MWAVFKIQGFVCKRFLPSFSFPLFYSLHSSHRPVILCSRTAQKRLLRRLCAHQSIDLLPRKTRFISILKLKNPPTDFIFGLVQSCQYDRTTTSITPFKFLLTFPQKIYGAADTAEEVDMQLKFTFFFTVISRSFFTENPMVDP